MLEWKQKVVFMIEMWCTAQCYHSYCSPSSPLAGCLYVPGFAYTYSQSKWPTSTGCKSHSHRLLRRRVEGTPTGLFHGCSHPNLPPPPTVLQAGIPGGHHPACAHPVPGAVRDWQQKQGVQSFRKPRGFLTAVLKHRAESVSLILP